MFKSKLLTLLWKSWHCLHWSETSTAVFRNHGLCMISFLPKVFRKLNRTTTTATTFFIVFSPPPPPPHFLLFPHQHHRHHHHHYISAAFSPPQPPPHFYCFTSTTTTSLLFFHHHHYISSFCSRVSRSEEQPWFLQLLADCPAHQRQFLLRTATLQQMHALVQVLYNVLKEHIPIPEENRKKLLSYKDALINVALPNFPYRTKSASWYKRGAALFKTYWSLLLQPNDL